MWQRLFSGPWPETENLLPSPVQAQAEAEIRNYWLTRGWQLVLGEIVLWAGAYYLDIPNAPLYGTLAMLIGVTYILGLIPRFKLLWLAGTVALFLTHGMLVNGLGAVTALSFMMPYTFAGMLLSGKDRYFIQALCMITFWVSLLYESFSLFGQLTPPINFAVSYNILIAAFTFQTLRFLSNLAVKINTVYVTNEVQQRSQDFLARVSHELRTPLNSVLGFAKLLERGDLTDSQQRYLNQVIEEGEHLNQLVSDLLDSAHLSTGKLSLSLEECDLSAICHAIAEEQRPNISQKITFTLDVAENLPCISCDKVRIRQAISNLVANAVKYTEQGEIKLKAWQDGDTVFVQVADTGIGIPEAEQKLIFVPFVQLNKRKVGVGLGLDIALQLVRLHGGDIQLSSQTGQGSTFTITLPIEPELREPHKDAMPIKAALTSITANEPTMR